MFDWLDNWPLPFLFFGALLLGLAPFFPEPHIVEKVRMLFDGKLSRPIDIFDLVFHSSLPILLLVRLFRQFVLGIEGGE